MTSFVKLDQFWLGGQGAFFAVFQIVDLAFQERILSEQFHHPKRNPSYGDDIHSAVRATFEHLHDLCRAADSCDSIGDGKQQSKLGTLTHATVDHFAVAGLEYVQREFSAGK